MDYLSLNALAETQSQVMESDALGSEGIAKDVESPRVIHRGNQAHFSAQISK